MGRITSKLSDLDLFGAGTPSPLNIKGKEKVHSRLGLLLTFLTVTFLAVVAIITFVNFVRRSNPSVVQSNLKGVLESEPFYINSENKSHNSFNFGFALLSRDDGVWLIDPSYYTVYARYVKRNRENNTFSEYNRTVPLCAPGQFQQNSYCLSSVDPDGVPTHILSYTDVYIDIVIQQCINRSAVICAPQEEIDKRMGRSSLYIYREDWSLDPYNYKTPINPINPISTAFIVTLTPLNYKSIKLYLNKMEIVTDNGWLFENNNSQEVTTLEDYVLDYEERRPHKDPYAFIRIQTKCNKVVYNRKYTKLQDVLAQVDGLATFILLVFCFLILPYSRVKMQETLVNEAFQLGVGTKKREESSSSPSKSSIHQNSPRAQVEIFEKGSQPEARQKGLGNHNQSAPLAESEEKKVSGTSDLSILKMFKSQSQPNKQSAKGNESKEEYQCETSLLCLPRESDSALEEKPPDLIKSSDILDTKKEEINDRITSIELPVVEKEEPTTRQYQPSINTFFGIEQRQTDEIPMMANLNNLDSQTQNLQMLQEQEILVSKDNPEVIEINLEMDKNQDTENHDDIPPAPPDIYLIKPAPTIQISFCQWLMSFFTRQSQITTLEKASSQLFSSLDIITLSRAIAELDILKGILLDHDQRVLFENLSAHSLFRDPHANQKPVNSIESENWDQRHEWTEKELQEAFFSLDQYPNKSLLDLRLLSLYRQKCLKSNA